MPETPRRSTRRTGRQPVTLPTQDACCQSPCDPAWLAKPSCVTYTETKTAVGESRRQTGGGRLRPRVRAINVTYTHTLCLVGKQHGPLAYTLTLLPGEKMTLYQSDRYRRTTSDTERYSVQTDLLPVLVRAVPATELE